MYRWHSIRQLQNRDKRDKKQQIWDRTDHSCDIIECRLDRSQFEKGEPSCDNAGWTGVKERISSMQVTWTDTVYCICTLYSTDKGCSRSDSRWVNSEFRLQADPEYKWRESEHYKKVQKVLYCWENQVLRNKIQALLNLKHKKI